MKPGSRDLLWMAAGAALLLAVVFVVMQFREAQDPDAQLAAKAGRVDLVARMRLNLAASAEAEKSAVLAVTDEDSKLYADQARAATAEVERERLELETLLAAGGIQAERDLLAEFSAGFVDLQRVDAQLLDLAVRNTNLKAFDLAFGPAADAMKDVDVGLSRFAAGRAGSPQAADVMSLAFGAQAAGLRLLSLLAPHVAEENEQTMDGLEARMAAEEQSVLNGLTKLVAYQKHGTDPDLQRAVTAYDRFREIKGRVLALSRENTNVRSLAMSLGEKRKVLTLCQDALAALQEAIQQEPIAGVDYGTVTNPRGMGAGKSDAGN